jgi:hypothetical protein
MARTLTAQTHPLSKKQRIVWGCIGGLLLILVSLLSVDLSGIIDHRESLTIGICIGYVIRVLILISLGGVIVLLNDEVTKPIALVQLGMAAPALVTAYINGASASAKSAAHSSLSIFPAAYAADTSRIVVADFWSDITKGLTRPLGAVSRPIPSVPVIDKAAQDAAAASAKAAQDAGAASAKAADEAAAARAEVPQGSVPAVYKATQDAAASSAKAAYDAKAAQDAADASAKAAYDISFETPLSASIINKNTTDCWVVLIGDQTLESLRRNFPPPAYDVKLGACVPRS